MEFDKHHKTMPRASLTYYNTPRNRNILNSLKLEVLRNRAL